MPPPAPAAHLDAFPDLTYADLDFPLDDLDGLSMCQVALMPYHRTATDAQKLWAAHKFYRAIGRNRIGKKDRAALLDIKDEGEGPDDCVIIGFKPAVRDVQGGLAPDAMAGPSEERVRPASMGGARGEQSGRDDAYEIAESVRKAIALAAEAAGASQGETSEGQRRNDFFEGPRGGSQLPYTDQRSSQRRTREDNTESRSKRRRSRSPRRESSSRCGSTSHRSPRPSGSHGQDLTEKAHSTRLSDRDRDDLRPRTSCPAEQYLSASVSRLLSTEQPLSEVQRGKRPEGVHRRAVVERLDSLDPWDPHASLNYRSSVRDVSIAASSAPAKRVASSASSSPLAACYSHPLPVTNAAASFYRTRVATSSRPSPALQFAFVTPSKESSHPVSTGTEPRQLDSSTLHDSSVPHRPSPDDQLSERHPGKRPEVHHPALPSSASESPDAWGQVASHPHIAEEESMATETSMASVVHADPPPATFDRDPSSFLTPLHKSESRTPPPLVERERFGKVRIPFTVAYLGLPGNCTLALLSHHLALSPPSLSPPPMALAWADGYADAPAANTKIAIGSYTSASESVMVAQHHFLRPLALLHPKRWIQSVAIPSLREFTWDQCCEEVQSTYEQTGSVPNYERDRGGPVAVLVREGLSQEYIDEVERIAKGDRVGKWKAGWGIEDEEDETPGTEDWRKEGFATLLDELDEYEEEEEEGDPAEEVRMEE